MLYIMKKFVVCEYRKPVIKLFLSLDWLHFPMSCNHPLANLALANVLITHLSRTWRRV